MVGFSGSFRDWDRFRLLIQRCKRVGEIGNFFDKGRVLPDESTRAPGEGYDRGKARDVHERSEGNERGRARNEALTKFPAEGLSPGEGLWPDEGSRAERKTGTGG